MIALVLFAAFLAVASALDRTLSVDGYPIVIPFYSESLCTATVSVPPGIDFFQLYVDIDSVVGLNYNVDIYGNFGAVTNDAELRIDSNPESLSVGDSSGRVKVPTSCKVLGCTYNVAFYPKCSVCGFGAGYEFNALVSATPVDPNGNRHVLLKLDTRTGKQEVPKEAWVYFTFVVSGGSTSNILEDLFGASMYTVRFNIDSDVSAKADKRRVYLRTQNKPLDRLVQVLERGLPVPGEEHTTEISSGELNSKGFWLGHFETELKAGVYTMGVFVESSSLADSHFSVAYSVLDADGTEPVESEPVVADACVEMDDTPEPTGERQQETRCDALSCNECAQTDGCNFCASATSAVCSAAACAADATTVTDASKCCGKMADCDSCLDNALCSWCELSFTNTFSECVEVSRESCDVGVRDKATTCAAPTPEEEEKEEEEGTITIKKLEELVKAGAIKANSLLDVDGADPDVGATTTTAAAGGGDGGGVTTAAQIVGDSAATVSLGALALLAAVATLAW